MDCQTQLQVGVISIWAELPIMLSCPQHMTVVGPQGAERRGMGMQEMACIVWPGEYCMQELILIGLVGPTRSDRVSSMHAGLARSHSMVDTAAFNPTRSVKISSKWVCSARM